MHNGIPGKPGHPLFSGPWNKERLTMTGWTTTARTTLLLLALSALVGVGMSAADPMTFSGSGVAAYGALAAILFLAGWLILKAIGLESRLTRIISAAFLLRLVIGIGLSLLLPVVGYDTDTQNAGYIFFDAYQRDTQAWDLAQSGAPLTSAFNSEFFSDQYGGMLIMSAVLYRIFSPDLHRPWLILLVTAFFGSVSIGFLYKAISPRFKNTVAWLAALIFAFYPESVLLGSAQMRDPILIGLAALAFYIVERWHTMRWKRFIWFGLTLALLAAFSWLIALAVGAMLCLWWWIDYSSGLANRQRRLMGWAFLALVAIAGYSLFSRWLSSSAAWDVTLAIRNSGWIAALFEKLPSSLQVPFIVVYGLLQPVLPAAIFDPSIPIWTGITTVLSLGWYLLLPILLYSGIALYKTQPNLERKLLITSLAAVVVWAIISSLRAGGDVWDNPRYRTLLIPWIALVAAWAWNNAHLYRDGWLSRWYIVAGIFVAFFSNWYLYRIFNYGLLISFWVMIGLIVLFSALVLGQGLFKEFRARGNPFTRE